MKQSSIEKLHAEGSELISKHLNGEISARDLIVMHHNLYYEAKEKHKQEIIESYVEGADTGEMFNNENRVFTTDAKQYYNEKYKSE